MRNFKNIISAACAASLLIFGAGTVAWADDDDDGYSWTGLYIGAHAGLANGNTEGGIPGAPLAGLTQTDFSMTGGVYGIHAGYNAQFGSMVLGIEGEYSGANVEGNTTCVILLNCQRELDWMAAITGRIGFAMNRALIYGKAGVVWGELQTDVGFGGINFLSGSDTHVGWTAGLGVEYAVSDNIIARIEYAHIDLGTETHNLTGPLIPITVPTEVDATIDTIKVGVSYKF